MSYIGNTPFTAAFLTDTFSGNGSTVAFTMTVAPANTSSILVAVTGVVQDPSTYSVSGTTLTFSAAPPSGTSNISVRYLGIPASGVTTTAYRTVTDTTATAGQTTFTIPSYTVGYVDVYRNGVRLAAADYTATTGTTVVLASAASAGDTITTESFYVSSVLNAIQQYNGLSVNQILTTPTANTLTSASGSNLQLQTNGGTTAMTLDTSGNAGLGVTPSAFGAGYKGFEIGAVGNALTSLSTVVNLSTNAIRGSSWTYGATGRAVLYQQDTGSGTHAWYNAGSGTAGNAITFTQAMTLDASGRLIINGTSAPSSNPATLNIVSQSSAASGINLLGRSSDNIGDIYFSSNAGSTVYASIETAPAYTAIYHNTGYFAIGTNGTERARIDSSGNLLVGTTSTTNAHVLQTPNNSSWTTQFVNTNASAPYGIQVKWTGTTPNNTSNTFLECIDTTNQKALIYSNGTFASRTSTYGGMSDAKLKDIIGDASSQWDDIKALRFRKYRFKDDPTGPLQLGLISQEAELVSPGLVFETPDTITDEEGNKVETGEVTKSVKYSIVYMKAVVALQEAMLRIEEQQAIITQLQADVAALKGQA